MKKSFPLVLDELKPIVEMLPQEQYNDEMVKKLQENTISIWKNNAQFQAIFPAAEANAVIHVNEYATIYMYKPQNASSTETLPLLYYIHGGGLILGQAEIFGGTNQDRANKLNAVVIAIDYRLAPDHKYPSAINDCVAGFLYVYENAKELGFDQEKISIYGESAGGGLAAALAIYLRDKHPKIKLKNQFLIYPMLDYKTSEDPENFVNPYSGEFLWTHEKNKYGWQAYKGNQDIPENEIAYFSAAHVQDYKNLPTTFMLVGSLDLFFEEDMQYLVHLNRSGVLTTLEVVAGAVHAFDLFPVAVGKAYAQHIIDVMKKMM